MGNCSIDWVELEGCFRDGKVVVVGGGVGGRGRWVCRGRTRNGFWSSKIR